MGLQFNNNVDQPGTPNQASPGLDYTAAMDSAGTIHRKGVVTRLELTGNLSGSRVWTPGTVAAEGWLPGDIVFVHGTTHTGGGFTVTIDSIAAATLATYAALLAFGCMLVFDGTDFKAVLPGNSTT